jgi:hypothetical protein
MLPGKFAFRTFAAGIAHARAERCLASQSRIRPTASHQREPQVGLPLGEALGRDGPQIASPRHPPLPTLAPMAHTPSLDLLAIEGHSLLEDLGDLPPAGRPR